MSLRRVLKVIRFILFIKSLVQSFSKERFYMYDLLKKILQSLNSISETITNLSLKNQNICNALNILVNIIFLILQNFSFKLVCLLINTMKIYKCVKK